MRPAIRLLVAGALLAVLGLAGDAAAFCGFFVSGANTSLYANATMVVLMRHGTRTVLSMENNYQGPPDKFALVIPVPTVLQQDQVKTLPADIFARVDEMGAPRLVEYWEQDPCYVYPESDRGTPLPPLAAGAGNSADASAPGSVKIEAQFAVGEYDIVILSANDSSALDTWLRTNQYNIPQGAEAALQPYVAAGTKFFVAKVDPSRVTFKDGQAALSPLRFYYDSQDFSLPVRLGLLNSSGKQDLIVNILAPNQRYEVANYANALIPTNIRVHNDVRNDFGGFYESLFQRTVDKNPRTVVTEYAWDAQSCDPCPIPPLTADDLATLGADVTENLTPDGGTTFQSPYLSYTLTRLHYRYAQDDLGEDLTFREAPPIVGGRGIPDQQGNLEPTVTMSAYGNNFQGRYVILHAWAGPMLCERPQRGTWGGPPGDAGIPNTPQAALNTSLAGAPPKPGKLEDLVAENVSALDVTASKPLAPLQPEGAYAASSGCAGCAVAQGGGWAGALTFAAVAFVGMVVRRRRSRGGNE